MDFLDSNAFEQMAREYNSKYSARVVGVLSSSNDILLGGVRNIFCKILKLYSHLERSFKRYRQFNNFFEKSELYKKSIKDFFKDNFNEELIITTEDVKNVNHKFCAIEMLNTYIEVFNFNTDVIGEIEKLKNCLILDNYKCNSNDDLGETEKDEDKEHSENCVISKQKLEYLISKLYELQEIFKNFTLSLQEFYRIVN